MWLHQSATVILNPAFLCMCLLFLHVLTVPNQYSRPKMLSLWQEHFNLDCGQAQYECWDIALMIRSYCMTEERSIIDLNVVPNKLIWGY